MILFRVGEEELTPICVFSRVGHGNLQIEVNMVPFLVCRASTQAQSHPQNTYHICSLLLYRCLRYLTQSTCWISSLNDEAFDISVEDGIVVILFATESQEVFSCFWAEFTIQFYLDISM